MVMELKFFCCGRPNIVVTGSEAFEEDDWASLTIGGPEQKFTVVKPCTRCFMVNVKQRQTASTIESSRTSANQKPNSAALADPRIFATLAKFRRNQGSCLPVQF